MPLHDIAWQHWYRKYWADSTTPSVIFEGLRAGSGSWTFGDQLFSLCSVKTLERPSTVRTAAEEESKPWHMQRWQEGNATSPARTEIDLSWTLQTPVVSLCTSYRELGRHLLEIFGVVPSHRTAMDCWSWPNKKSSSYHFLEHVKSIP